MPHRTSKSQLFGEANTASALSKDVPIFAYQGMAQSFYSTHKPKRRSATHAHVDSKDTHITPSHRRCKTEQRWQGNNHPRKCEKAAEDLDDAIAHEEELTKGIRENNFNPAFITRLSDHIFKVDELLDEYRHLILDFHEATGDATFWQTMAKKVEETTLFDNMASYHIQKAHLMKEQAKNKYQPKPREPQSPNRQKMQQSSSQGPCSTEL